MSLAPSAIESLESRCLLIAGDLVGTFGNGGVLYHDGIDSDLLAVQSDGGVLAVSGSRILRFTPAGASDPGFGVNGSADAGFDIAGLEVQPDGRIVVGGVKDEQWAAARFTAAGAPDTSFGNGGVVLATPASGQLALKDIAIQPDGKIVLLANWKPDDPNERFSGVLLARFNRDGTPDSGFAVGGQTVPPNNGSGYTNHRTLTVDRDGNLVTAGDWHSGGLSFEPSYSVIDPTGTRAGPLRFGDTWAMSSYATYVDSTTRADGTVVLAQGARFSERIASINLDEKRILLDLHPEWADNFESVRAVASASDNKVIVAGEAAQGTMHTEQSTGDDAVSEPNVITLQRLHADGTLDTSFGDGGRRLINLGAFAREVITAVKIASDGDIVALGWVRKAGQRQTDRDYFIARFDGSSAPAKTAPGNRAGDLDGRFGDGGVVIHDTLQPTGVTAIQSDGKVLLTQGTSLVRLDGDRAVDTTFGAAGRLSVGLDIDHLVIDPRGRIVVSGRDDQTEFVARFNADGTPDASFGVGGRVEADVALLAVQPDSKIVLAQRTLTGEQLRGSVVRLNEDGSFDTQFGTGGRAERPASSFSDEIRVLLVRPDGTIVVAGQTLAGGQSLYGWYEAYDAAGKPIATPDLGTTPDGVIAGYKDGVVRPDGTVVLVQKPSNFAARDLITVGSRRATADFVPGQSGGNYAENPEDLAADYRNRLVVGGYAGPDAVGPWLAGLQRLSADGTPDLAFGIGGSTTFSIGYYSQSILSVETLSNGDIIVVGTARRNGEDNRLFVARVNGSPRRVRRPVVRTPYAPPRRGDVAQALPKAPAAATVSAATARTSVSATRRAAAPVRPLASPAQFGLKRIRREVIVAPEPRDLLD